MRLDLNVGVDLENGPFGGFHLGMTDGGLPVDDLALEVGFVNTVEVHDPEPSHPGGGQVSEERGAESPGADGQNPGGLEFALTLHGHLRHDQVPGVAAHFGRTEVQRGRGFLDS